MLATAAARVAPLTLQVGNEKAVVLALHPVKRFHRTAARFDQEPQLPPLLSDLFVRVVDAGFSFPIGIACRWLLSALSAEYTASYAEQGVRHLADLAD
jgi:hypothetical protein